MVIKCQQNNIVFIQFFTLLLAKLVIKSHTQTKRILRIKQNWLIKIIKKKNF